MMANAYSKAETRRYSPCSCRIALCAERGDPHLIPHDDFTTATSSGYVDNLNKLIANTPMAECR